MAEVRASSQNVPKASQNVTLRPDPNALPGEFAVAPNEGVVTESLDGVLRTREERRAFAESNAVPDEGEGG
jgi:hypothetical protein